MANDCIPTKTPATEVTGQATAAITGKRFVVISATRVGGGLVGGTSAVQTAGPGFTANTLSTDISSDYQIAMAGTSGVAVLGVSGADIASGAVGTVWKVGQGHILPVTAGGALTHGTEVQTDATGKAIVLASGKALGYVLDDAQSGADAEIVLY
jgi:Uncharacterized conserved protein (DUF2190)